MKLPIKISFINDNILPITILIQAFGLLYFIVLYSYFNISIIFYINLTDVLLYSCLTISTVLIYIFVFRYVVLYNLFKLPLFNKKGIIFKVIHFLIPMSIHLLLIWAYFNVITALEFIVPKGLILLFLTTYVGNEIDQRLKDFQSQPYSEVAVEKSDESTNYIDQGRDKMLLTVLGLGILGIAWMLIDSEVKTVKKSARVVEFTIDSISIKTGNLSNTKFIGETSDYLFTYDTVSKSSSIYNKSEIKSIKVFK